MPFRKTTDRGLRPGARTLTISALNASRRARRELLLVVPLIVGTVLVYANRQEWFARDLQKPIRFAVAICIAFLGYRLARDLGRSVTPWLFRRMDAATAGTVRFFVRLVLLLVPLLGVLRVAGVNPRTRAGRGGGLGGGFGPPRPAGLRRRVRPRRAADARHRDRRPRAHLGPAVPGRRPGAAPGRRGGRPDRGRRRLARPAVHDARPGRGLRDGPQQRRALRGGRAAA